MHPRVYEAADQAEDLILDLKPLLEGYPVLTVMLAIGEILALTLAHEMMPADAREAFLRSVLGRASDMAGDGPRVH
jgi:hypothetical protein